MKKIAAVVISLVLIVSVMAGCNETKQTSGNTELTIMMLSRENGASGNSEVMKEIFAKTGIKANVITPPQASYNEKLNVILASGNLPDIVYMDDVNMNSWIDEGALLPLDDLIDKYAPNFRKQFTDEDRKEIVYPEDMKIYGMPYMLRLPAQCTMGIRRDWLETLGMSAPTTIEELETVLTAFKNNADKLTNGGPLIPMAADLSPIYMAYGIMSSGENNMWTLDDKGNYISKYEHPNYRQCLETIRRFYKNGLIDPEYMSRNADANAMYTLFNSGIAGCGFVYSTRLREITGILKQNNPDAFFDYMPPVDGVDGQKRIIGRKELGTLGCITIAAEGKEKECMEFLDWAYSEEGDRILNYGIEGKSYNMVDGNPVITDEYNKGWVEIRKLGVVPTNIGYNRNLDAYNQCMFNGKSIDSLNEEERLTYRAYYENEPFVIKPLRAFNTETSMAKGTDVYAALTEAEAKAIIGSITVDEFFNQLKKIKNNGLDDITKEMQEYWDKIN